MTKNVTIPLKRLIGLLMIVLTTAAYVWADDGMLFVYKSKGGVDAYPQALVKSDTLLAHNILRITLENDSVINYQKWDYDSISTVGPALPSLRTFKFNNKYNDEMPYDVEATEISENIVLDVPSITKNLTPSFSVTSADAKVYVDGEEQQSTVSRHRFDHDITYTVGIPDCRLFTKTLVREGYMSEEVWSEDVWQEAVWGDNTKEVELTADMLSTNQPSNYDDQGLEQMLDGDPQTFHQSTWGNGAYTQKKENVELTISLPRPISALQFYYLVRDISNYNPTEFVIHVSKDSRRWKPIATVNTDDGMPRSFNSLEYTSAPIELDASYKYFRFELTHAEHYKDLGGFKLYYLSLAEFRLFEPELISPRTLIDPAHIIEEAEWHPDVYRYSMEPYGHDYTVGVNFLTESATDVPRIDIDIDGGKFVTSKSTFLHANFRLSGNGVYEDLEDSVWIKGRGNTSWGWPKKPYRLKFDKKVKPFGLKKGKSWVLLSNYQTNSMMTNAIGMKAARLVGTAGANHIIPVDLYMNGEYMGSYNFTEKVGISNNSVDIDEETGVLLELDQYYDERYRFTSAIYAVPVNVKDPDLSEEPFKEHANEYYDTYRADFNAFNTALYKKDSYEQRIDIDAFARFLLVNDLILNIEICHPKSTYVYKADVNDPESKYVFGPVWDLDWGFGYEDYSRYYSGGYNTVLLNKSSSFGNGTTFFKSILRNNETVRRVYYRVWYYFLQDHYQELLDYVQDYCDYANPSFVNNAYLWGDGFDYPRTVSTIRNWLDARVDYIMSTIEAFDIDEPIDGIDEVFEAEDECVVQGGETLLIMAPTAQRFDIYSAGGILVKTVNVEAGVNKIALEPGIYLVNNKKVMIH